MYGESQLTEQQKFGIIVCLPKRQNAQNLDDYRPLTILNADFKLLTRITANRLKPWMPNLPRELSLGGEDPRGDHGLGR
jgi:hypothetical protein